MVLRDIGKPSLSKAKMRLSAEGVKYIIPVISLLSWTPGPQHMSVRPLSVAERESVLP